MIVCCECRAFEKYNNCKHGLAAVAASRPPAVQPISRRAMHKGKAALGLPPPETYQLDTSLPPEDKVPAAQSGARDLVPAPDAGRKEVRQEQVVPGYLNKLEVLRTKLLEVRRAKETLPKREATPQVEKEPSVILDGESPDQALNRLLREHDAKILKERKDKASAASSSKDVPTTPREESSQVGARGLPPAPAAIEEDEEARSELGVLTSASCMSII